MKIGIDLTSLQGPHRMRGIGYTLINLMDNVPETIKSSHRFVFFVYSSKDHDDPLSILNLEGVHYELREIKPMKKVLLRLPGKLNRLAVLFNKVIEAIKSSRIDRRIRDFDDVDVFLQTDQSMGLPKGKAKKVFIAYDLIPYVLEWDYLWAYRTARLRGRSIKYAVFCAWKRRNYLRTIKINTRRSDKILSISETTEKDFMRYIPSSAKKIEAIPLGVSPPKLFEANNPPKMHRYMPSSWGYIKRPYTFSDTPYLLFIGGADWRRRLDDLVTAFNHLRATGLKLNLVLTGDTMKGPLNISVEATQQALLKSSYIDDIIFMGFVDDRQRDWLYKNALSFVFPSQYEGFGLPVLEAFSYSCPVISYRNQATVEVAGDLPIYTNSAAGIAHAALDLMNIPAEKRKQKAQAGVKRAQEYSWQETSRNVFKAISTL